MLFGNAVAFMLEFKNQKVNVHAVIVLFAIYWPVLGYSKNSVF